MNRKGFTLTEVLISSVIFIIGAIGTLTYFFYSESRINLEGHRRTALEIAQSRIEFLKTVPYNEISSYIESEPGNDVKIDEIWGKRITLIEDIADPEDISGDPDYKKISVMVRWFENKKIHEVKLITLISPH